MCDDKYIQPSGVVGFLNLILFSTPIKPFQGLEITTCFILCPPG
jgi:hypothetical protein